MNSTNAEEQINQISIQPGAYLFQEREKRGISLEQVSSALHLRVQVLKYLEGDEYEHLPQEVFVQGYIRAYCKFLSISADDLIESYIRIKPQSNRVERGLWQNSQPNTMHDKSTQWLSIGLLLIAVGAGSFWLYQNKMSPASGVEQWHQSTH